VSTEFCLRYQSEDGYMNEHIIRNNIKMGHMEYLAFMRNVRYRVQYLEC
jgi:hypothetical protein